MNALARATTYAKREPWLLLGAVLVVISCLLSATAAALAYTAQRASCERGNDFRREDLPAAFEAYSRHLGTEFDVGAERGQEAYDRFAPQLDVLFPTRDC